MGEITLQDAFRWSKWKNYEFREPLNHMTLKEKARFLSEELMKLCKETEGTTDFEIALILHELSK